MKQLALLVMAGILRLYGVHLTRPLVGRREGLIGSSDLKCKAEQDLRYSPTAIPYVV